MSNPVKEYVNTRIAVTKCLQKHFKQLCSRCPKYTKCELYAHYCDAWRELQIVADKEISSYNNTHGLAEKADE